jgi:hypothetical protein
MSSPVEPPGRDAIVIVTESIKGRCGGAVKPDGGPFQGNRVKECVTNR